MKNINPNLRYNKSLNKLNKSGNKVKILIIKMTLKKSLLKDGG